MNGKIEEVDTISPNKYRKVEINEDHINNDQKITIFSILKQGIQSKDKNMLENALSFNDLKTIKYSVLQLTDNHCLELFEEIMNRIENNPMKLLELHNWISIIINRIAKIVIKLNGDIEGTILIINQMERLNEIITMRLSYNKDLIHLQSTLDIFQRLIEENRIMSEMCKKLSSDSNNALITYQFENQEEKDEDDQEDQEKEYQEKECDEYNDDEYNDDIDNDIDNDDIDSDDSNNDDKNSDDKNNDNDDIDNDIDNDSDNDNESCYIDKEDENNDDNNE